jgi:6-phosphogluconolactonase
MSSPRVLRFEDAEGAAGAAAGFFADCARRAVERSGRFTVALSGGSTPRRLYARLTREPFLTAVSWKAIEFFWGDERAVPPDHPDSNYRMARESLLDHVAAAAERVHRMHGDLPELEDAAQAYEEELARVFAVAPGRSDAGGPAPNVPAFDLVLLGLGPDAHTASLFPGTAALGERERWVAANDVPALGTRRLTLTPPVLNAAAQILFLVTGEEKAAPLASVLEGPRDPNRFPAQLVEAPGGAVSWFVDGAAAAMLREAHEGA